VLAVGVVAGQVVGGLLVSADFLGFSWRSVFLINVPVGIILVVAGRRSLPSTRASERRPFDLVGVGLCAGSVLFFLLPLLVGREEGWSPEIFAAMAAGAALAVAAAIYFRRLVRRGGNPLLDPRIVSEAGFALALASLVASTMAWGGFLFAFTLYLQEGLGYSALHSGLLFIPYGAGFAAASLGYGRLPGRLRPHLPRAGLAVTALAYAVLGLIDRDAWHALASAGLLAIAGAGYGFGFSPMMAAAVARVPITRARDASGILTTAIQLSYAIGITVLGSLFLSRAELAIVHPAGSAFSMIALFISGLALVAAALADVVARRSTALDRRELQVERLVASAGREGSAGERREAQPA
jgi:Major Facilitator Superfamily